MGYTHYWQKPEGSQGFIEALPTIKKVLERYKYIIQLEYDEQEEPICNDELVCFNGVDEYGHETFLFSNDAEDFAFCKTARKPYDIVVCECLLVFRHFMPNLRVSSDGIYGSLTDDVVHDCNWNEAIDNVGELYGINVVESTIIGTETN